jgi:hypothetical protein
VGVLPLSARLTDVARSVKRLCALEGIPVRRPLTMEVLVIVRPGLLTPADIRIFLALGRQHGHVTAIWAANVRRSARCLTIRHDGHHLLEDHLQSTRWYLYSQRSPG